MSLPTPDFTIPDPTSDNARAQAWSMLTAKYYDAGQWAAWGSQIMNGYLDDIKSLFSSDVIGNNLSALSAVLSSISLYTPASLTAPTDTIDYTPGAFSDGLLTALKARLTADIATSSTGLGNAEAALLARETARQNAIRAASYAEVTTMYAEWPMPPGAAQAQINRLNSESAIRLSDSSSQIMAESARLAVDYNKHVLSVSTQLVDALSRVFDSEESRKFEKAKQDVLTAFEGFRSAVQLEETKQRGVEANAQIAGVEADIAKTQAMLSIETARQLLERQVATVMSLAQGAQQIISSALNGVSSSTSFGFSGHQNQVLNTTE